MAQANAQLKAPAPEEEFNLIGVVEFISSALTQGQDVLSFFQPSQPTMEDIAKAFAQEVQQIFNTALAQEDIRKATANLEAARQFFPGDYANARNSGQTPDQLTALINGSDGPGLAKLRADADLMATWVGDPSLVDGGQATVNQAATLYLAIQSFICVIHRELSKQATDPTVKATELADMKTAASTALTTMKDIVMNVVSTRCQSLSVGQWSTSKPLPPPDGGVDTHFGATLQDSWLHPDGSRTLNTNADTRHGPSDGDNAAMQRIIAPYQRMLWFGGDDAESDLTDAVNGSGAPSDSTSNFINDDLPALRTFATWATSIRTSLISLDRIARGAWVDMQHRKVLGTRKQDGWRYCNGCGSVFLYGPNYPQWQGTVQKVCPVYGVSHAASGSYNYMMCYDAGPSTQDGWAWCMSCGMLHFGGGGGDACPMGAPGPHGPPAAQVANVKLMNGGGDSTDIQSGWRWCHKCAALHWPSGRSVCTTGGAHSSDGSGNYQLEYLGNWSPPV